MSIDLSAYKGASGFLFIGDPHVSSKRVGRRKDDYLSSVLQKLEACAQLCDERNLVPVCLGDLLHRNDDSEIKMLNRLTRTLKKFSRKLLVLSGNHDLGQTSQSDEDVLTLLGQTEVVALLASGEVGVFEMLDPNSADKHQKVRLWACAYGDQIPTSLPRFDGQTVMVTHHDLAFGGAYPGARPLTEVENCTLAVNGHMHDTKPSVRFAGMVWHNPGNIEPLSVDLATHKPCAWEWTPSTGSGALQGHALPHGTDLFDLAGLHVEAASSALVASDLPTQESSFARLLAHQTETEAARTEDATVLKGDLETIFETQNASDAVRRIFLDLAAGLTSAS